MKWCKHFVKNHGGLSEWWYSPRPHPQATMSLLKESWDYCPHCGTPRPKENSLAKKFWEYHCLNAVDMDVLCNRLAEIAEEHFREKK